MSRGIWQITHVLGTVAGIASLVLLARQAFTIEFVAPLHSMLEWYRATVDLVFSPIAPHIERAVPALSQRFPDLIGISPQWKHYLVLGAVVCGACVRAGRNPAFEILGRWIQPMKATAWMRC